MAVVHAGYLSPGCWDQNIITQLFDGALYPHHLNIKRCEGYPNAHGCILVIPGKFWADHTATISEAIATYDWVLAFRCSDEEDWFDIHQVRHPNLKWWVQYQRTDREYGDARFFGAGFPPHFNKLPATAPDKDLDLFLSAQRTQSRRYAAFDALEQVQLTNAMINETEGFTLGLVASAYVDAMLRARVAPSPSGAVTPDSFRLYEALESHAVPIADDVSPLETYDSRGFWSRLFPDAPFRVYEDAEDLGGVAVDELRDWPANANEAAAWWIQQKRRYAHWLREDLTTLGAL